MFALSPWDFQENTMKLYKVMFPDTLWEKAECVVASAFEMHCSNNVYTTH